MNLPRLYPIIDLACFASQPDPVLAALRFGQALLDGGATMIQLRDKTDDVRRFLSCARELRRITRGRAILIINDRADLAIAADADGVHLGQDDLSPEAVRQIFDSVTRDSLTPPFAKTGRKGGPPGPEAVRQMFDSLESHPLLQAQKSEPRSEQRMGYPALPPDALTPPFAKTGRKGGPPGKTGREGGPPAEVDVVGRERPAQGHRQVIGFSTHNLEQLKLADKLPIDYLAVGPVFATSSKAKPDPVVGLDGVRQARAATSKPLVAIGGITRKNCLQVVESGADSVAVISDLLDSPAKAVEEFLRVLR